MNKKLVALAVGGAFALPLAAQAQTANVTLYGRLNLDLEFVHAATCQNAVSGGAGSVGVSTGAGQSQGGVACSGLNNATPANAITNTTVNRVSSELVALRHARHGKPRRRPERSVPDRIERSTATPATLEQRYREPRNLSSACKAAGAAFTMGKFLMPMDDLHPIFGNAPR